jgi:chorismate mutase
MKLQDCRDEIDQIDKRIVTLLNRRAALVREIGAIKAAAGLPVIDRQREAKVLEALVEPSEGLIDDVALARIYRTILLECRRIQVQMIADAVAEEVAAK